jgi:hypothetical protein
LQVPWNQTRHTANQVLWNLCRWSWSHSRPMRRETEDWTQ